MSLQKYFVKRFRFETEISEILVNNISCLNSDFKIIKMFYFIACSEPRDAFFRQKCTLRTPNMGWGGICSVVSVLLYFIIHKIYRRMLQIKHVYFTFNYFMIYELYVRSAFWEYNFYCTDQNIISPTNCRISQPRYSYYVFILHTLYKIAHKYLCYARKFYWM
jgi:hypothetical protein